MEKFIRERESNKKRLTTLLKKIEGHKTVPLDAVDVTHYAREIPELWKNLQKVHEKIGNLATSDIADHEVEFDELRELVSLVQRGLERIRISFPTPSLPVNSMSPHTAEVRLPRINLPSFSGDVNAWISFRDMFVTTIHLNTSLSDVQKFTYLQSSLTGSASKLIALFTITDANYQIAWEIIQNRFNNERELFFAILQKFTSHTNVSYDPTSLRSLVDATNQCTRALDSLNIDDKWDALLVFFLSQKLDSSSRQSWELSLPNTSIPKSKELLDFMEQRARSLTASGPPSKPLLTRPPVSPRRLKVHHARADHEKRDPAQPRCSFCDQSHFNFRCTVFQNMTFSDKERAVKKARLCFNCLRSGHSVSSCPSDKCCSVCKKRHHSLLHLQGEEGDQVRVHHARGQMGTVSLLATVLLRVKDKTGGYVILRGLSDGGSTDNFITENAITRLGLIRQSTTVEILGLSSLSLGRARGVSHLDFNPHFESTNHWRFSVEAYVIPRVTGPLPPLLLETGHWKHLQDIQMADPHFNVPGEIDLLLGADIFYSILMEGRRRGPRGTPVAVQSKLGWLIAGQTQSSTRNLHAHHAAASLDSLLDRFWNVESLPTKPPLSKSEDACETIFKQTVFRNKAGRFVVHIPMKTPEIKLGLSRESAVRRLMQVERRLFNQPKIRKAYVDFMKEYEDLGHMKKLSAGEKKNFTQRIFLPHHFVRKGSGLEKFRVVFDASSKTSSGNSLNDAQLVGATIQDSLHTIIMRFRQHPVAFKADIEKMYRQVLITEDQQDLQCILWRKNEGEPVQEYKLLTVTYGTASAPFLATRVLHELAEAEEVSYPLACRCKKRLL